MVTTRGQARLNTAPRDTLHTIAQRLRGLPPQDFLPASNKHAAVLVPLFEDSDGAVKVWLTRRAAHLSTHQGEVCLPGGKRDPSDADDVHTALREAHEEIGLEPSLVEVICRLPPVLSKHMLSVTPVIGRVPASWVPRPNAAEVGAVFSMPLPAFLEDVKHKHQDVEWQGFRYRLHFFDYEGFDVWGLTAGIMVAVARVALGQEPAFEEHGPRCLPYNQLYYDGAKLCLRREQQKQLLLEPHALKGSSLLAAASIAGVGEAVGAAAAGTVATAKHGASSTAAAAAAAAAAGDGGEAAREDGVVPCGAAALAAEAAEAVEATVE